MLDGVAGRLDEGREISRYIIGLLVFLGLLGTFWGLLQTIGSVSAVVGGLDLVNSDFESLMAQLRSGLDAPLSGMATAFSSSLFGLAGSLILGFLDLQLGQAIGRFSMRSKIGYLPLRNIMTLQASKAAKLQRLPSR